MAIFSILCPWDKMRKGPYLGSGAENDKTKTTFPSRTLKVGEKKVPLFLCLVAPMRRYGHFLKIYVHGTNSPFKLSWKKIAIHVKNVSFYKG